MQKILGALLFLFSTVAVAHDLSSVRKAFYEKLDSCGQAVSSDSQWMVTSLPNTANGIGHIRLQSLTDAQKSLDLPAADTVVDAKVQNGVVYVLTETTFEAWTIATAQKLYQVSSIPGISKSAPWPQKANGFVLNNNRAIIAHGSLGLSVINLSTRTSAKVIPMQSFSLAQDIDLVDNNNAVVAVDNGSDGEFRGVYVLNLQTLQITKQIKIDNAYPLSIRVLPNNILRISYINGVWQFDLQKVLTSKEAYPAIRTWQFPGVDDFSMKDKVFYDDTYMYSCFDWVDNYVGGMGMDSPHPRVFKLEDVKLK